MIDSDMDGGHRCAGDGRRSLCQAGHAVSTDRSTRSNAAKPAVLTSIEADADYLLNTTDFMDARFGMGVEDVRTSAGELTVRTTGAEFVFEPAADTLLLRQRLGKRRDTARVTFAAGALAGLTVERKGTGSVLMSAGGGRLQMRINGDSLLMIKDAEALSVSYEAGFHPAVSREYEGHVQLLDEYGGIGSYPATGPKVASNVQRGATASYRLAPEHVLWISISPPRPYDWDASLNDRVVWHWSKETGYPADAQIEEWSRYGNILLQQSEVMLWQDWSLRFVPRHGVGEFERVVKTCRRFGMRNIVYTSPFYFLAGTDLEDKAMNSFENFKGFSPGNGRGDNWPLFVNEIARVMREYKPGGLYFDGIYNNVVRTYLVTRKAREIVGDTGLLEYHATLSPGPCQHTPPGNGLYVPQIDTWYNFILRGEGRQENYGDDAYLRYSVSTYNISNSIGVICNNYDHKFDKTFIDRLLDNNVRMHFLIDWEGDSRLGLMEKHYWPTLTSSLRNRVGAASERRENND